MNAASIGATSRNARPWRPPTIEQILDVPVSANGRLGSRPIIFFFYQVQDGSTHEHRCPPAGGHVGTHHATPFLSHFGGLMSRGPWAGQSWRTPDAPSHPARQRSSWPPSRPLPPLPAPSAANLSLCSALSPSSSSSCRAPSSLVMVCGYFSRPVAVAPTPPSPVSPLVV